MLKKQLTRLNQNGYTLIEMLVVLIIMSLVLTGVAVFGFGFSAEIKRQAFEEEAKTVCRFFNDSRKLAMMGPPNTYVTLSVDPDHDKITRITYEGIDKHQRIERLNLHELEIHGYNARGKLIQYIRFTGAGTISQGTTYHLRGSGGNHCYLIIQPVTGRMYLSHTKPK